MNFTEHRNDDFNGEDDDSTHRLESLNLSLNDLSGVSPESLTNLLRVLRVNLAGTKLHHDQVTSLIQGMSGHHLSGEIEMKLRHLILCDVDLSAVNQEILASICGRLSTLNLKVGNLEITRSIPSQLNYFQNTELSQSQVTRILTLVSTAESNLDSLNLSHINLGLVTPDLPSRAALKV